MFARALIAFLALPGIVAFAIPAAWLWCTGHTHLAHPLGLLVLVLGTLALLWCVRDFYISGKGTLAPWAPPERLVVVGLYRYSQVGWVTCLPTLYKFVHYRVGKQNHFAHPTKNMLRNPISMRLLEHLLLVICLSKYF